MRKFTFLLLGAILSLGTAVAQVAGDQLGVHDLTPSGVSPVKGGVASSCLYCHAPHSAMSGPPLWNQTLSTQAYNTYTSSTYHQTNAAPLVDLQQAVHELPRWHSGAQDRRLLSVR